MNGRLRFDEEYQPVPPAVVDADPVATMRDLFYRVSRLEQSLEEQSVQAEADLREILLALVVFSDELTALVERWGVTTKAQDAALIRGVVALGRSLRSLLERYHVSAIDTLGKPVDPDTSDVEATEVRANLTAETVLRESQTGYRWSRGVLRRAKVVVGLPEPEAMQDVLATGAVDLDEEPATGEEVEDASDGDEGESEQ